MVSPQDFKPKIKKVLLRAQTFLRKNRMFTSITIVVLLASSIALYATSFNTWTKPQDVRVTNIGSNSVTISWRTSVPTKGAVIYDDYNFLLPWVISKISRNVAYDDRDYAKAELKAGRKLLRTTSNANDTLNYKHEEVTIAKQGEYYIHHVTLKDLEPKTTYYFKVGNSALFTSEAYVNKIELDDNFESSNKWTFDTYTITTELRTPNPIYGTIADTDGEPIADSMIFARLECVDTQYDVLLSAVSNNEGG